VSIRRGVFEPQSVPEDYVRRSAIRLVLRPKTFYCNARDLALLKDFITAQVPRYADLCTPTIIITGDHDTMVSPDISARALAATLPCAKLVLLKDIGHMPHHVRSKEPAIARGFKASTTNPETIRRYWRVGDRNIAIATGAISGVWVLDVDGDAAPEVVATAIDKLVPRARIPWANPRLIGNSALAA